MENNDMLKALGSSNLFGKWKRRGGTVSHDIEKTIGDAIIKQEKLLEKPKELDDMCESIADAVLLRMLNVAGKQAMLAILNKHRMMNILDRPTQSKSGTPIDLTNTGAFGIFVEGDVLGLGLTDEFNLDMGYSGNLPFADIQNIPLKGNFDTANVEVKTKGKRTSGEWTSVGAITINNIVDGIFGEKGKILDTSKAEAIKRKVLMFKMIKKMENLLYFVLDAHTIGGRKSGLSFSQLYLLTQLMIKKVFDLIMGNANDLISIKASKAKDNTSMVRGNEISLWKVRYTIEFRVRDPDTKEFNLMDAKNGIGSLYRKRYDLLEKIRRDDKFRKLFFYGLTRAGDNRQNWARARNPEVIMRAGTRIPQRDAGGNIVTRPRAQGGTI